MKMKENEKIGSREGTELLGERSTLEVKGYPPSSEER